MSQPRRKHPRKNVLLAAIVYVAGVIALISWSYIRHHRDHIHLLEAELTGTAVALQELLHADTQQLLADGAGQTELFRERLAQLQRIADQGQLLILGVVSTADFSRQLVAQASLSSNTVDLAFLSPLAHQHEGETAPRTAIVNHPELGPLHLALLVAPEQNAVYISALDASTPHIPMSAEIVYATISGIILMALALPLAIISRTSERLLKLETEALNSRLKQDVKLQKSREKELKDAISDLERFNSVSSGRESRIIELKHEVNELLKQLGEEKRYNIESTD